MFMVVHSIMVITTDHHTLTVDILKSKIMKSEIEKENIKTCISSSRPQSPDVIAPHRGGLHKIYPLR